MDSSILTHLIKAFNSVNADELIEDWIRLKSILKDYAPSMNKEISVIISFQVNHLAYEVYKTNNKVSELDFMKLSGRFSSISGYERKTAEWCTLIWCNALNKELSFTYSSLEYPSPFIEHFDITPNEVVIGEKALVSWKIKNSMKVFFIFQGKEIEVKEFDSRDIVVKKDEIISIKVIGFFDHSIIERREVTLIQEAEIKYFKSNSNKIISGNPVKLLWDVENVSEVRLSHTKTLFKPKDEVIVCPLTSTTYILSASNKAGEITAIKGIRVIELKPFNKERLISLPQIKDFTLKQKTGLIIPRVKHTGFRFNFPDNNNKPNYSTFNETRTKFITDFYLLVKQKAKKIISDTVHFTVSSDS